MQESPQQLSMGMIPVHQNPDIWAQIVAKDTELQAPVPQMMVEGSHQALPVTAKEAVEMPDGEVKICCASIF